MSKREWLIASWNINSIRRRKDTVKYFLKKKSPDILCLQEIKCSSEDFPQEFFFNLGYKNQLIYGQKAYHGVAILSRHAFLKEEHYQFGERKKENPQARHIYGSFKTDSGIVGLHNFYVPAGGDEPDPQINEKFAHKLRFVKGMEKFFREKKNEQMILVGDLNIAPYEHDVWSHKNLLNVVSHTPIEVKALKRLLVAGQWIDIAREFTSLDQKLYSWWSYRARDWRISNRGRRLDHIWTSPDLLKKINSFHIEKDFRGRENPSDHVPIWIKITL